MLGAHANELEDVDLSDVAMCFDLDILANPYHDKRVTHLRALSSRPCSIGAQECEFEPARRLRTTLLIALCGAVAIVLFIIVMLDRLSLRSFFLRHSAAGEQTTLHINLENPRSRTAKSPVAAVNAEPVLSESEGYSKETESAVSAGALANPVEIAEDIDQAEGPLVDFQSAIQDAIQQQLKSDAGGATRSENYQRVFDPRLEEKLASEEIAKFNRPRVYEGREFVQNRSNNYIVMDGRCYYQAAMEVIGFESGGLPPQVRQVDCDELFGNARLTRDDVQRESD